MRILILYGLILVVILVKAIREGFTSSPSTIFKDLQNKKVLLLVYLPDCIHCKRLKPEWDKAEAKNPDKMVSIDASDSSDNNVQILTSKLNVSGYPSIFVMNNGVVVKQYEGGRTEQDLLDEVNTM